MTKTAILITAFCATALVFACAIDPGPFFTPPTLPEDQAAFNQGSLGLLTPTLNKENELIAFRLLSGLKLGEEDKSLGGPRQSVMTDANVLGGGQQAWIKARQVITNPRAPGFLSQYRTSHSSPRFVFYLNCLDDAFETAARTLADRRQHYASQADITSWAAAQDQVFSDCSSNNPTYPGAPASGASPLTRADREYQIAAAHFYAEDLQEAERRFRSIAADQQSPWRRIGEYMVGRTLLREVSLQNNAAAGPLARRQFEKIAADASAGSLADSARGLLQHLNAIEHSGAALEALSKQLLLPRPAPKSMADTLLQSRYILTAEGFRKALSGPDIPEPFDWVQTLENGNTTHILERWESRHSLPWLALAWVYAGGNDQAAAELIEQADRVAPGSPAFGTATYNAIRLRIERGETEQPRKQLDTLLAGSEKQPDSLVNGWRAERMRLAIDFDDFLRWAPRKPINAAEFFRDDADANSPVLAPDSAYVLNYRTPLSKLSLAAHSPKLPPWSASDVALAVWTRAFMLNDFAVANDVAPIVAKAHPDWASSLQRHGNQQPDAWKFRAALLIALHREFQPLVPVDYRKHLDAGSWWCSVSMPDVGSRTEHSTISWRVSVFFTPPERVISEHERITAQAEIDKLREEGSAPSFLAPIIFNWAKAHPDDPLVPQALHRLVVVVRYGCPSGDPSNGRISKAAFDLLHKRYPKNEWTAKTPHWFN
jgi:hypothetical protein